MSAERRITPFIPFNPSGDSPQKLGVVIGAGTSARAREAHYRTCELAGVPFLYVTRYERRWASIRLDLSRCPFSLTEQARDEVRELFKSAAVAAMQRSRTRKTIVFYVGPDCADVSRVLAADAPALAERIREIVSDLRSRVPLRMAIRRKGLH